MTAMTEKSLAYKILRSARKTISIQITPGGEILVRCPNRMRAEDICAFVESKRGWIEKHLTQIQGRPEQPPFTREALHELAQQALMVIPERVRHYAQVVGVTYGRITIRSQHSRWGSCSSRGNLNFNCLLMLAPPEVLDYVVVHELCHRKEMNHSAIFWEEVERVMPDYQRHKQWLKENGSALIGRLPK